MSPHILEGVLLEICTAMSSDSSDGPEVVVAEPHPGPSAVALRGGLRSELWSSRAKGLGWTAPARSRIRRRMLVSCSDEVAVAFAVVPLNEAEQMILELSGELVTQVDARHSTNQES